MSAVIHLFQCRTDNFGALVHDSVTGATAAIDVPDAATVRAALNAAGWRLTDILVTHGHADHVAGVAELATETGARVFAKTSELKLRKPALPVDEGSRLTVGGLAVEVLATPGHTDDDVAFYFPAESVVFVGDTLFSLGCGRLFSGTPAIMWASLAKLRALPDHTKIYCGHEYTATNARFALTVEPDNAALVARAAEVRELRANGRFTLPTTIAAEKATNPFLRADVPKVANAVGRDTWAPPAEVFGELRRRKDRF